MGRVSEPAPESALIDVLRLWRVDPRGHSDELAAALPQEVQGDESFATLQRIVEATEERLGLERLTGAAAQDAAVAAMCRRVVEDRLTPRELTYWVTRVIGWRGSARTQALLDFEQAYCDLPLTDEDVAALDGRVRTAARYFLVEPEVDQVRTKRQRVRRFLRRSR